MDSDSDIEILSNEKEEQINISTWSEITCNFLNHEHFLENPIKLPCNKNACLSCILRLSDAKSKIKCTNCRETHNLDDPLVINKDLNERVKRILKKYKIELCLFARNKLKEKYNIVTEKCQNLNAKVELKKRKFEDDLEDRINVLKDHNDSLHKKSLDTIKNFKSLIIDDIERNSISSLRSLEDIAQSSLIKEASVTPIDTTTLYNKILDCENDLKTLNCLSRKATMYINQIHFDESNSVSKDLIGEIKCKDSKIDDGSKSNDGEDFSLVDSIVKIKKSYGNLIVPTQIKYITDFNGIQINLNTRYIINDCDNNLLILNLWDNKLYKINLYGKLMNVYCLGKNNMTPRGIALNDIGELFLTNISNNKIIKYSNIDYRQIDQFGDDLNGPRGIECFKDNLFICDYNNKRIRIYNNKDSSYVNDIFLDESTQGPFYPFNIKIKFNKIFATDLMNSIRIFDLNDFSFIVTIKDHNIYEPRGLIIDTKSNMCVSSKSIGINSYILYCYDVNGNYLNQMNLGDRDVFDILLIKHQYNGEVFLVASLGEHGLISYKMES